MASPDPMVIHVKVVSDPNPMREALDYLNQIRPSGYHVEHAAELLAAALGDNSETDAVCVDGPMAGALLPLRDAYQVIRLDGAPEGQYVRTHIDVGRWEYHWVRRTVGGTRGTNPPPPPPGDRS